MSKTVSYAQFLKNVKKTRVTRAGMVKIMRENDAIEASKINGLASHTYLKDDVRAGLIRLDDIMRAGGQDLQVFGATVLREALRQLGSGSAKFTAEDISTILSSYSTHLNKSQMVLELAMSYGTEFALSLKSDREISTAFMLNKRLDRMGEPADENARKKIVQYAADLEECYYRKHGPFATSNFILEHYAALSESGVPAHVVIEKGLTLEQALAVGDNKSAQSIAEGWL